MGLGVATDDAGTEREDAVGTFFFMAAILAAISARFCAIRSAVTYKHIVNVRNNVKDTHDLRLAKASRHWTLSTGTNRL